MPELMMLIPLIIYFILIAFVVWLVMRLIRANEKIAFNAERIANALTDMNARDQVKKE